MQTFAVGPGHRVLAFWQGDKRTVFVAGTEAEAGRDLGGEARPEEAGPRNAARIYLRVLAKAEDPDALDDVMDWEAVRKDMMGDDPRGDLVTAKAVAKVMKDKLRTAKPSVPRENLELLEKFLQVSVEGDAASAIVTRDEKTLFRIRLRKREGTWRIVHWPR